MGLDMYLEREIYIGGRYEHTNTKGTVHITQGSDDNQKIIDIDPKKICTITTHVAYWRKVNHIHAWFTKDWDDDRRGNVSSEELIELVRICKVILEDLNSQTLIRKTHINDFTGKEEEIEVYPNTALAMELLPPQEGFFFGSYIIDDWYKEGLEETIEQLDGKINDTGYYVYTASY